MFFGFLKKKLYLFLCFSISIFSFSLYPMECEYRGTKRKTYSNADSDSKENCSKRPKNKTTERNDEKELFPMANPSSRISMNFCYVNSLLQCFFRIKGFVRWVKNNLKCSGLCKNLNFLYEGNKKVLTPNSKIRVCFLLSKYLTPRSVLEDYFDDILDNKVFYQIDDFCDFFNFELRSKKQFEWFDDASVFLFSFLLPKLCDEVTEFRKQFRVFYFNKEKENLVGKLLEFIGEKNNFKLLLDCSDILDFMVLIKSCNLLIMKISGKIEMNKKNNLCSMIQEFFKKCEFFKKFDLVLKGICISANSFSRNHFVSCVKKGTKWYLLDDSKAIEEVGENVDEAIKAIHNCLNNIWFEPIRSVFFFYELDLV